MGSAYFDAHSLWQRSEKPLFTSIVQDLSCDVCIVGAGIAGLSVGYQLLKAGQKVIVLDRERLGLGETALTSAHLSNAIDDGFYNLVRWHGVEGAKLAAESHAAAIDTIAAIQADENIDCEFQRVDGYLFLDEKTPLEDLARELEASKQAGLSDVELLPESPLKHFDLGPCLRYPRQAQFHPMKYLDGLATAIKRLGGQIFTHSEGVEVRGGHPAHVRTSQGFTVKCDSVVVATNVPINNKITIHTKLAPHRTYIAGIIVPPEMVEPALFWDTAAPYHYVRFVKDPSTAEDILLVGGEDHRTGQDADPENHFSRLRDWLRVRFDLDAPLVTRWSGQIIEPVDGLAYIGRNPGDHDNVYIITGDSGHGLTHGTLAGRLITDLILGHANPWAEIYDPARLHLRSIGNYVRGAVEGTAPYGDWLSEGDVPSVQQIEPGEGAVVREGLRKIAVYRDELNRLHSCSAICTHLGGIVRWNSAEKTWDCPCHGSRYDRFGQVLNGPANAALEPAADPLAGDSPTLTASDPTV
jgi:glycine/D-amino acid oxidase-like deaminating enzyme/nitrite reductase/ring-hydroxylating ferredoxin subunit